MFNLVPLTTTIAFTESTLLLIALANPARIIPLVVAVDGLVNLHSTLSIVTIYSVSSLTITSFILST